MEKNESQDSIVEEIVENVRKDREKLKTVRDQLVKMVTNPDDIFKSSLVHGEEADPALPLFDISDTVENIARVADVMVKQNAQLLEVAKLRSKSAGPEKPTTPDELFDEIENAERTN